MNLFEATADKGHIMVMHNTDYSPMQRKVSDWLIYNGDAVMLPSILGYCEVLSMNEPTRLYRIKFDMLEYYDPAAYIMQSRRTVFDFTMHYPPSHKVLICDCKKGLKIKDATLYEGSVARIPQSLLDLEVLRVWENYIIMT